MSVTEETVELDGREVRCRKVVMPSGRALFEVWQEWTDATALPSGAEAAMRDTDGSWWRSLDDLDDARHALREAFPGAEVGAWSWRWSAFVEVTS